MMIELSGKHGECFEEKMGFTSVFLDWGKSLNLLNDEGQIGVGLVDRSRWRELGAADTITRGTDDGRRIQCSYTKCIVLP